MSPLGGSARRLSDFPARSRASWSPDGRWLATAKARSGERPAGRHPPDLRRERRAACGDVPEGAGLRRHPGLLAGRPGARLRLVRGRGGGARSATCPSCPSIPSSGPRGGSSADPTAVAGTAAWPGRVTGARSSTVPALRHRLWRVRADGGAPPERVELAGAASFPSTVNSRDRLAFVRFAGTRTSTVSGWAALPPRSSSPRSPTCIRSTRRTAGGSPSSPIGRVTGGDLAGRCRRVESHAPDARPGPLPGIARLVAGRALDRLRLAGRGRPCRRLDDRRRRLGTAPGHARPRGRHRADLVARRPLHLLQPPTGRVASRSGARRPVAERKSSSRAREEPVPSRASTAGPSTTRGASAPARCSPSPRREARSATILPCVAQLWATPGLRGASSTWPAITPGAAVPRARTLRYWDAATGQDRPVAAIESDVIGSA